MHPNATAVQDQDLELVSYGAGHAWLRPELDAAIADADQVEQDLSRLLDRYTLTETGRDYLARERAMAARFGPWPTVAEASA